jgi:hypothetical protein
MPRGAPRRAIPGRQQTAAFTQRPQALAVPNHHGTHLSAHNAAAALRTERSQVTTWSHLRDRVAARLFALPQAGRGAAHRVPSLRRLGLMALAMELCAVCMIVFAPLGGLTETISPVTRAWPWLLWPAHLVFPNLPLHIMYAAEHDYLPWPTFFVIGPLLIAAVFAAAATLSCLRAQRSTRWHLALVLAGAALVGGTLVLLPSLPSDDVFSYIMYGRISALHHANPLLSIPAQFTNDPFLSFVYWRDVRSVYGSVWLLTSSWVTLLAQALGGAMSTYVLLFKLLGLACHLINATLIWLILGRIAPTRRLMGTLLYAWCPLCLLEFGASGHNDALMATFLLLSVYLLVRHWDALAMVAFGLSVATKYVPLALLPLYLYAVARQVAAGRVAVAEHRLRLPAFLSRLDSWVDLEALWVGLPAMAWRAAIVFGVVAVTMLPYWGGPQTLNALLSSPPAERLTNSWAETLSFPLQNLAETPFGLTPAAAFDLVGRLLKVVALVAFVVLWLRQFRRAKGLTGTLEAWAWALLWYVAVASGWFWPWYITWLVVVVALLPWSELSMATLLLAGGVLLLYMLKPFAGDLWYSYRCIPAFAPALGYLLGRHLMRRRAALHGVATPAIAPEGSTPPLASTSFSRG